jgi:hypothetical protein
MHMLGVINILSTKEKKNSVAFSLQVNYTN